MRCRVVQSASWPPLTWTVNRRVTAAFSLFCLAGQLAACSPQPRFFGADEYPQTLSAWGIFEDAGRGLQTTSGHDLYALNTPLFSDYALKLRTVYLPASAAMQYAAHSSFRFPTGTVISKTFYYPLHADGTISLQPEPDGNPFERPASTVRLIETRLLVKQDNGWDALPYVWRGDDAYLAVTGDLLSLEADGGLLNYLVPSRNQCAGCHATNHSSGAIQPIGLQARHLHRPHPVSGVNQLTAWSAQGKLQGLPNLARLQAAAAWQDTSLDLEQRARAYLDINCAHCHNPAGAADTSGLLLNFDNNSPAAMGVCKPPIAAGRGSGGHLYSIVPGRAAESILAFRMQTRDPATMMPELGRTLVHTEGYDLIAAWINGMAGECL